MQEFFTAIRDLGFPIVISGILLFDYSKKLADIVLQIQTTVLEQTKTALQLHEVKKNQENMIVKIDKLLERKR